MKVIIEECSKTIDVVHHCSNGDLYVDQEYELDYDVAHQMVYAYVGDDIKEEILTKFEVIPSRFESRILLVPQEKEFEIDLSSLEGYIEGQLEPMEPDYDDYEPDYSGRAYAEDALDCIFRDGAI